MRIGANRPVSRSAKGFRRNARSPEVTKCFLLMLSLAVLSACNRPSEPAAPAASSGQLETVLESAEAALAAEREIPRFDLVLRAAKHRMILRQVELSNEPMDRETRLRMVEALDRADRVMPAMATTTPVIRKFRIALADLGKSLRVLAGDRSLQPEVRSRARQCERRVRSLLDDLDLVLEILSEAERVNPQGFFDPGFEPVLREIHGALKQG
jgi:hypothetical protein